MNDTFLYQYRRPPRPEFADALYARISSAPRADRRPKIEVSLSPLRQMVKSVAVMAAALFVVWKVSPQAREQIFRKSKGKVIQWQTSWL
jgi:hypothetical protein